ncbi:MAG: 2-succinyl-5-enolpyruvyl-6-hydroxy-3-cyclohexene-1-carboxylic-acid synthase, partial [Acidimicrobiales bacterium]
MAATLVDEWARAGLTDVVICPGSRSTPLTLGAARHDGLRVHVRLDERGAAFFALGRALATGHAAAIVVTSGTAAAELHAAVAEADLAHVPLLVVTADRPPEMHGVGASQTINQRDLYGAMVRRFEEPGVARADAAPTWRPLASRLWHAAHGDAGPPGPVHVNLAFVEPLVTAATPPVAGRDNGAPWLERDAPRAAPSHYDVRARRVLCVVGAGVGADVIGDARSLDWVVVGDATARGAVPYADALLRDDGFASLSRPDVVVRVGGLPASRVLAERLREWGVPAIGFEGAGPVADPDGLVSRSLAGLPNPLDPAQRGDARYTGHW